MVEFSWPRVQYEKNVQRVDVFKMFEIFISIQGVQATIWEGPEPIPELKNISASMFSIVLGSVTHGTQFQVVGLHLNAIGVPSGASL